MGYKGASGNRDTQLASRSVLNDFTGEALTISASSLFQNGTARILKAYWRWRVGGTNRRGHVALCGLDG